MTFKIYDYENERKRERERESIFIYRLFQTLVIFFICSLYVEYALLPAHKHLNILRRPWTEVEHLLRSTSKYLGIFARITQVRE